MGDTCNRGAGSKQAERMSYVNPRILKRRTTTTHSGGNNNMTANRVTLVGFPAHKFADEFPGPFLIRVTPVL